VVDIIKKIHILVALFFLIGAIILIQGLSEPDFERNTSVKSVLIPDDPDFHKSWSFHNTGQTNGTPDADIDAPEAWALMTGSDNIVVIAILDTGVDYNHPDLVDNIWTNPGEIPDNEIDDDLNGYIDDVTGWDFVHNDNDPMDDDYPGHGTHAAGIIGAIVNNSRGIAGVNWDVKIMPIKFIASDGFGTFESAASSIEYATTMGADIISNSWGIGEYNQDVKDAVSAANELGILFIAAAGDYRSDTNFSKHYPASYDFPNVVSVASTDHNDDLSFLSNYGAQTVHLGAPGDEIYSTTPNNTYSYLSGTSMAVSHVTGVAALIKAQNPDISSDRVKAKILAAVDPLRLLEERSISGGRLNAYNSLEKDSIQPSPAIDLRVTDKTFYSVTLSWSATGDDRRIGTAKLYDMRYSTALISEENWESATKTLGEPKPQSTGSTETYTVRNLLNNTTYYFGLRILDNVGNPSELSSVQEITTTPIIIFEDNMENGVGDWTHTGVGDNWQLGIPESGPEQAYSGHHVWATNLTGDYGTDFMDASLMTPLIDLKGIRTAQLSFQHFYNTQTDYDGAIVEVSDNNGDSWIQITPLDGYTMVIADSSDNPLGAVPAYGSYVGAKWQRAVFNISDYDEKMIKIRFRFGSDFVISRFSGWYIDDVVIRGEIGKEKNFTIGI
jgi:hypothetical protein